MSARVSRIAESPGAAGPLLRLPARSTAGRFAEPRGAILALEDEVTASAACAGIPEEHKRCFYPAAVQPGKYAAAVETAKRYCSGCPVRESCLQLALLVGEAGKWGIWGGTDEDERQALRRDLARRAAA